MASAERESILENWGLCRQWVPGTKPLVGSQGGAPEAEEISAVKTLIFP
jgi:hypothetical protein